MLTSLLPLALLAGFVTETVAYGSDPKQAVEVQHPVYDDRDDQLLRPVVIFLHGGVWQIGDRKDHKNVGLMLAANGFVGVVASYRLAPAHRWPAQIDDAAAVVALVKKRAASWGGDPNRIILVGHSAGGQLASLLLLDPQHLQKQGLTPSSITALVTISGVFDLRAPIDEGQHDGGFARFIAPVFGADVRVLRAASPIDQGRGFGVPTLLLTSTGDYTAMRAQTEAMARLVRLRGEHPPVIVVEDRDHYTLVGALGRPGDRTTTELVAFIKKSLRAPPTSSPPATAPLAGPAVGKP